MTDRPVRGTRAVATAVAVRVIVAAAAGAASAVTGSVVLLAAGFHAAADAGTAALLLVASHRARRGVPAGHDAEAEVRRRSYWAMVVGVGSLLAGAVAAVAVGLDAARDPTTLTSPEWAFGALGAGVVLQMWVLRNTVVAANDVRGRGSWLRFIRAARSPGVPVVLVQGIGALVGLIVAVVAVATTEVTDDAVWDGVGSVVVGVVLALLALVLLAEVRTLLIGEPATRKDLEAVTAAIEIDPAVHRLLHLHTRHEGPDELLVAARVELDHELSFPEVSEVIHRIERNLRRAVPIARSTYIEPDLPDERRAAPAVEHHQPGHDIPPEIRARLDVEARRGSLGEHIVVEDDLA